MAQEITGAKKSKVNSVSARVLKVMGLFSGVQVLSILTSVIRTKLVAIWLGPAGMGLFGLYYSGLETISSLTQMGTGTGVVRELAVTPAALIPRLVTVIRRWGLALGLIGATLTVALSPLLSRLTFGDENHTTGYFILAAAVLLLTLSNTESAVFQGLHRYSRLAKTTVAGAFTGLIVCIPMYYFWGIDSVIPSLLAYALMTWICRGLFREKVATPSPAPDLRETFATGKGFAILGIYITVTTFASNAVSYVFMSYLNRVGGPEQAGFYQAGFTLVNRYIGLVLVAVGMEYLPRLSQVNHSPRRIEMFLSHELTLMMLVILPLITLFITADELIVNLLYDRNFIVMLPFITWGIVGTVFRTWSWCLAYIILARSDGKAYLVTELLSAFVAILLNIVMFNLWGIAGLGYGYTLWYLFYLAEVWILCRKRYHLRVGGKMIRLPIVVLLICAVAAVCRSTFGIWGAAPFVILSLVISWVGMKRLLHASPLSMLKKFVRPAKKD